MVNSLSASVGDAGDLGSIPGSGQEDLLEKEMATHSSILAWEIPLTEEPWSFVVQLVSWFTSLRILVLSPSKKTKVYGKSLVGFIQMLPGGIE